MQRLISIALLCAAALSCGPRGPEGPPGPAGPEGPAGMGFMGGPSISTVVPAAVTQGSEYDLTISGFSTDWTDAASVSLGMGITVTRTKAASPTSLLVHVRVAPDAKADVRDVTVTQGMTTVRWTNAFSVLERVKFSALGTASQMSLSVVRLAVNEPQFEFDTSTSNGVFVGVSATASPAFPVQVLSVSSKNVDMVVLANEDAGVGAHDVNVISREGTLAERKFSAPMVFTVTPRQSSGITEGVPVNGSIDKPYQSATYEYQQPAQADGGLSPTLIINVQSSVSSVTPKVAIVPSSGRWADMISFRTSATVSVPSGQNLWLVVWESSGAYNFSYTLSAAAAPHIIEEEPNEDFNVARLMPVPGLVQPAQLGSLTDVDWFKMTATAADVGKRFHVVTQPGDVGADPIVEVFRPDGTTTLGGPSDDNGFHEDWYSDPIPIAGDYFVKIENSSFVSSFNPTASHYDLLVTVE